MQRYSSSSQSIDDPSTPVGDQSFVGVNEFDAPENIPPGQVQNAVNVNFSSQDAVTRGGFACLPELGADPFADSWYPIAAANNNQWQCVAYGGGVFVALSNNGTGNRVMSSPDGTIWTVTATGAPDNAWGTNCLCYGNGMFVAVSGGASNAMYSADGYNWTQSDVSSVGPWSAVTFGNGRFVAVGVSGKTMLSTDAITWTSSLIGGTSAFAWGAVTYGTDNLGVAKFVAVCSNSSSTKKSAVSLDNGANWTIYTSVVAGQLAITFGNGLFVSVGIKSGFIAGVQTSPDGQTWTERIVPYSVVSDWLLSVAFGNNLFVSVTLDGNIISSADGITWTLTTVLAPASWRGVTFGEDIFVAVAQSASVSPYPQVAVYSPDSIQASGIYTDPNDLGSQWIMLVSRFSIGFFSFGRNGRTVSLDGYTVTTQSTIVQCNNLVYLFRGDNDSPLYWDGDWSKPFALAPGSTGTVTGKLLTDTGDFIIDANDNNLIFVESNPVIVPIPGFENIPNSNQATYYQNRLWVKNGKDKVSASDVLDFSTYDQLANSFNLNTGSSDYIVSTYPFGQNSLIVFKNKSIIALLGVQGSLTDVTATEVTRQVGCIGINAVVSIGPDLAYVSDRNINLITLTSTNNAVQHKTLPLSSRIKKIMNRVNWQYGYKISMAFFDNKLFVSLPLDNETSCNGVVVYNFITEHWFGEWNFASAINMNIQGWAVVNYLGVQRLHAITEDGRIFVTEEGQNDVSDTTVSEISTSLTTRAYDTYNLNHFQRRMFMDMATNRPNLSVSAWTDGASEESVLLTNQTYARSESWKFNDSTYLMNNASDDFNRAYRKDYASGVVTTSTSTTQGLPSDGLQCGSGFNPELPQEIRMPLITRRQGRLSWIEITNTQGFLQIMSLGFETRPGQRSSLTQV